MYYRVQSKIQFRKIPFATIHVFYNVVQKY